jgi:CheY-like chemotaxis protein
MKDHNLSILVVDDEEAILQNMKAFLEDEEYSVTTACSAEEAAEIFKQKPFDVGLFDIRLPGMNGDELAIQASQTRPDMKILLHTGFLQYSLPRELKMLGMTKDNILYKPLVDMDLLIKAIQNLFPE